MKLSQIHKYLKKVLSYKYIQEAKQISTIQSRLTEKLKTKFDDVSVQDGTTSVSFFTINFKNDIWKYTAIISNYSGEWYPCELKEEPIKEE